MDHLEQENRELKEEVARLSALMESFLAAQNQSSPTPATPPQRTVISEIVSSTVPAASAHFVPTAMPSGFPWGMPPDFMPDIPAPTFASMPTSSPVLAMPPPVVHTTPRVDDTINHSEPSEGPDVHEKMDALNDQFLELRKELKNLRGKDLFGKSAAELCLVPGVKIHVKFKVPDFDKYKGNTLPTQPPGHMIASAPSDFTDMVNMGMRLEEGVCEGRLSKDEGSSSKRYGAFAKKKDGEAHAVVSHVKSRRPSARRKTARPAVSATALPSAAGLSASQQQ
ncbi:hypothetical protein KIW84_061436 [Lathyrus oleraceus]|uniref:Uncharacterized protein n=1 Tax=Pisum sativum TaxID=3888 RepID=A0A9D4W532_PEA|nr:hypothetical protein KIW84_061436 [Pisum sativum]